jgi:hypothetical protein
MNTTFTFVHTIVHCVLLINTCVSYMPSNITVIVFGVLFYPGYMFRRLIGPSSGNSGGLHYYYQSIYIFTITITLDVYTRTQANQKSISEIRDLLSQCNSYSENVNT